MKSITVEKLLGNNKNYQQVTGNEESLKSSYSLLNFIPTNTELVKSIDQVLN